MLEEDGNGTEEVLSVTEFVEVVNEALLPLEGVAVEGEISEYRITGGNKWVHFSLKDKDSTVRCFMPRWYLHTEIEDGMVVRVIGLPRLHEKWNFSLNVSSLEPAGEGALKRAFELMKKKLESEGVFALERKRELPRFPETIVLITSREAAAYSDFVKVLKARQGGIKINFIHAQVQGREAPGQIVNALQTSNTLVEPIDAVVLVRGGGGLEDLQAFNDEEVVRAVAGSRVPVIAGVGHERDITLAGLAADVRASTPSNAAEILVSSREEVGAEINGLISRAVAAWQEEVRVRKNDVGRKINVMHLKVTMSRDQIRSKIDSLRLVMSRFKMEVDSKKEIIKGDKNKIKNLLVGSCDEIRQRMDNLTRMLKSMSPQEIMVRGYSITCDDKGRVIKSSAGLRPGSVIDTRLFRGNILSTVESIKKRGVRKI
jgi:exodeoxyribonuclease VII large subunit